MGKVGFGSIRYEDLQLRPGTLVVADLLTAGTNRQQALQDLDFFTHRFKFDDYLEAYHAIEQSGGEYMKVMIELD